MDTFSPQILSILSGSLGIIPAYLWLKTIPIIGYTVCSSVLFTIIQHSTEKLHKYPPIVNIGKSYKYFLWLDRSFACLLIFLLYFHLREKVFKPRLLLISGVSLLVICDSGIIIDGVLYSIIHSLWHSFVWMYLISLYKIQTGINVIFYTPKSIMFVIGSSD